MRGGGRKGRGLEYRTSELSKPHEVGILFKELFFINFLKFCLEGSRMEDPYGTLSCFMFFVFIFLFLFHKDVPISNCSNNLYHRIHRNDGAPHILQYCKNFPK